MVDIDRILKSVEKNELEAEEGAQTSQIYSQLLAAYLFKNQLCNAKHLWKRIPRNVKNESPDIKNIWLVAQKMWQRDWPAVHIALRNEWNENVSDIMNALKDRISERALFLVEDAYSSLEIRYFTEMTGLSIENSREVAREKDWSVVGSIIHPKKNIKQQFVTQETTEYQLHKLTQFVTFLEN
ncbi:COP9 signalosome complex subunit 8 [Copidosoma floridanum]|uniref:COP9 signalosome complex subunit 8 n=1 Tax=Copidosoma floridanum TaxID=29053 RepID=UPI0006C9C7AF|nr:COP9 signalosome complex subunit 8 [Copidosoma floridanum]